MLHRHHFTVTYSHPTTSLGLPHSSATKYQLSPHRLLPVERLISPFLSRVLSLHRPLLLKDSSCGCEPVIDAVGLCQPGLLEAQRESNPPFIVRRIVGLIHVVSATVNQVRVSNVHMHWVGDSELECRYVTGILALLFGILLL